MEFQIELSALGRLFMLPAAVVDEHLKSLSGDSIKVLLCVYCLGKGKIDSGEISKLSGVSEDNVQTSLETLAGCGLIKLAGFEYKETPFKQTDLKLIGGEKAIKGTQRELKKMARVRYSPKELAQKIDSDSDLKMLCESMEELLAKPLTHSNLGDIVEMYEHLELSPAVIMMIAEYCKGRGKTASAYILKVAANWFEEGISDFESVERKIINSTNYFSFESKLKRIIGIETNTTKKQREFFEKWQMYGFSDDMLELAYDKTVNNCDRFSIAYMNKILTSWFENGIKTPLQAEQENNAHKAESSDKSRERIVDEYEAYLNSLDYSTVNNGGV